MNGTAIYGDGGEADSLYRYVLTRKIDPVTKPAVGTFPNASGAALLIGLNPSKATADSNDPTITRETDFVRRWGFDELWKCNAFAFRETDPDLMKLAIEPVGPENNEHILRCAQRANLVVICWGNDGCFRQRDYAVRKLLIGIQLHCFGKTKSNQPKHPLYLKADTLPVKFYL